MDQTTVSIQYLNSESYPIDAKMLVADEAYIRALIMNNQHWVGMKIVNQDTNEIYGCIGKLYPIPGDIESMDWALLFDRDWIIYDVGTIDGGTY